jgi:peptidoglycan hydrolase-like protein with peptidoglycan-binding domain
MRSIHWILALAVASACFAVTPAKNAPANAKTKKVAGKAVARKSKGAARPVVSSARVSRPQTPAPERYKEIQQALADKGYLKSEPTGVWNTESADALRQFQTENNLSPTGKLSAASLISLGLGPKNNSNPVALPASPRPVAEQQP